MLSDLREAAHKLALQVAIDGPAGAGKSTVGRGLATELECPYLDTGLMYRAIAWLALQASTNPADGNALAALTARTQFTFSEASGGTLQVNGEPALSALRSPAVDACVSEVSAHPRVRELLVARQRAFAEGHCIVMVGRDIGTTVLPTAPVKFWITASAQERARRRLEEGLPGTAGMDEGDMAKSIRARDTIDSSRTVSPLRRADDAVELNTDAAEPRQVLESALTIVRDVVARLWGAPPPDAGVFLAE